MSHQPVAQARESAWPPAFPYPHFMGFAPLDVWLRFLFRTSVSIPPRYWLRLALALLQSLVFTILTLPERILTGLWLRFWRPRKPLPGPVIVLGYYRSGTTLLQYLLSRDPNIYAPHWAQAFAPQGFCLSWTILRWGLLPFLPRTRPQDNVAFGPLVPAEDDFALNAWALASTLPGRVMVPQAHAFFDRFHDLKELTTAESQRWRRCQLGLVRKISPLAGQRRILLKTPSHTARIDALLDLFKNTDVKFVYITRHPHKVFQSNVRMLQNLSKICGLGPPLEQTELEDYLCQEFVSTEEQYQHTRALIPAGSLAEVRLQDLQADPLGTMQRVYKELGLPYTPAFEQGMIEYLHANRDFQPNVHPSWTAAQQERIVPALQPLVDRGRHDESRPAKAELPPLDPAVRQRQLRHAMLIGLLTAALFLIGWLALTSWLGEDSLGFIWLGGIGIGLGVLKGAGNHGATSLGLYAMLLTVLTLGGMVVLANGLFPEKVQQLPFYLLAGSFWWLLALASAFRIGSQRF